MLTGIYQSAAILAIIAAFYVLDFWFITRYDRQRTAEGSGRSWDFTLLMVVFVACLVAQPVALPALSLHIGAWWGVLVQAAGAALAAGGLALNWWSRIYLQQFYAERVEIQPDHLLVDTGPYARVRHPVFTSFFMIVIGCLLVNPALPTLAVAVYAFWDFSRAARQEEDLLKEKLPGYTEYIQRTARFFPIPHKSPGEK